MQSRLHISEDAPPEHSPVTGNGLAVSACRHAIRPYSRRSGSTVRRSCLGLLRVRARTHAWTATAGPARRLPTREAGPGAHAKDVGCPAK